MTKTVRATPKKRLEIKKALPVGKGSWRVKREILLNEYVKPNLRKYRVERQRKDELKLSKAEQSLKSYGLGEIVEPEVMAVMQNMLDEIEQMEEFPDWILDPGCNIPGKMSFDKYRQIRSFEICDGVFRDLQ